MSFINTRNDVPGPGGVARVESPKAVEDGEPEDDPQDGIGSIRRKGSEWALE